MSRAAARFTLALAGALLGSIAAGPLPAAAAKDKVPQQDPAETAFLAGYASEDGGARGKADMHLHTLYSDGTAGVEALLRHVEANTDLDLVAITDHERLDGALRAREIHAAGDFHFELVVGEEITTRRGGC